MEELRLPALGMILLKALVEVLVGEVLLVVLCDGHNGLRLRVLLEVFNVVGCVSSLHGGQVVGALVLAFPQQVLTE